jgi:Fe-S-cluster-containing dehydrogenase component/anaerobic selenocysteine-containing dehydrogenase
VNPASSDGAESIGNWQFAIGNDEFPPNSSEWPSELSRRHFLQITAASVALAGATGCTRNPPEKIVPYRDQPEEIIPGKPLYYATALTLGGYARGVLVETHEGRPTKIEGNPQHPASLGTSDVFMQAELLTLFDPERSAAVMNRGQISTWEILLGHLAAAAQEWKTNGGAGLRLLTRHETSPTFLDQVRRLLAKYPAAKWHEYEPLAPTAPPAIYHFEKAEVIVSLGADFLASGSASLKNAHDFAAARRPTAGMNRLYVAESTPTLTGAMADHRFIMRPKELRQVARELASEGKSKIANLIMEDLRAHAGKSVVVAGEYEPAEVHNAARHLNETLGNVGTTVDYPKSVASGARNLRELINDIRAGSVETLIIIGGNPVFDAPADFSFAKLLPKISLTMHGGLYHDETAALCRWHIPLAHELETWSDACAFDDTATIMQPVIEPLFAGRSRHELLAALLEEAPASPYEILRAFWQKQYVAPGRTIKTPSPQSSPPGRGGRPRVSGESGWEAVREAPGEGEFGNVWRRSLHDGVIGGGDWKLTRADWSPTLQPPIPPITNHRSPITLLFRPSARLHDGRFANNAWLQELPDPLTQIVWDNAALISPAMAERLRLVSGEVVNLKFRGHSVRAPVSILPGQADDCVTVHLGYGRTRAGSVGNNVGFNAGALRMSDAMWGGAGLEIEKTGAHQELITTQHHWRMEGRDLVRTGTIAKLQRESDAITKSGEPAPRADETLYPPVAYHGHAWAMVIDLNTCIGCGVCTIACQAENNIPVVGKEQVAMNREMHWIRVDRYYEDNSVNPRTLHQPVPCMHCENAPCELVCPVAATVHSSEGLNQMVYNRCIGTRYCSNNCPYKVRRFNFLEYDANKFEQPPTRKLMRNPDVTVRTRGVMEKCTYCIQRINAVKIEAEKMNRAIRDGEIMPACAQACPADAIVFGDGNDANSRVAKLRESPLNYGLLAELNARPRTTYLAKLWNPHPHMEVG